MHCVRLTMFLLVPSLHNIFITLIIRESFVSIRRGNNRYSVLIKILSIFNIFHIIERSWRPITIINLIEPILFL